MKPKTLLDKDLTQERDLDLVNKRILSYIATAVARSSKAVDSKALKKTSPTIIALKSATKVMAQTLESFKELVDTKEIVASTAKFKKILKVVSDIGNIGNLTSRILHANKATIKKLITNNATIDTADISKAAIGSGTATLESANISELTTSATTTKSLSAMGLTAEYSVINSIRSNRISTKEVTSDVSTVKNLSVELANIAELECKELEAEAVKTNSFTASAVKTNTLSTINLQAQTINSLDVTELRRLVTELLKAIPDPEISLAMIGEGKVSSLRLGELFKSEEFFGAVGELCSRYIESNSVSSQRVEGPIRFGGKNGISVDPIAGVRVSGPITISGTKIVDGEFPTKPKVFATEKHLAKEPPRTLGIVGKELRCVLPDGTISKSSDNSGSKAKFLNLPLIEKGSNNYYKLEKLPINPNSAIIQVRDRKSKNSLVEFESYSENGVLYIKVDGTGKYFVSLFGE